MKSDKLENIAMAFTAVVSILLGGSAVVSIVIAAGLLSELAAVPLHAQTKPSVELEAAIAKEQVDGDLKTAAAAFQKIAANNSASREVRAKALLHLAGCYEKLGQQQAQKVYEQVVRDFADQPSAAQARVRLAALTQDGHPVAPTAMTQRKIETLGRLIDPWDTDGHRAVYLSNDGGELIYSDLAGHGKRVIFKANPGELRFSIPSRDFSMVRLGLRQNPGQPPTVAVVNADGTGYREIAKLDGAPAGCWSNWSWDNRYVLACTQSPDGTTRLLRISVSDGRIRELLSLKSGHPRAVKFSPDGRFVAYALASQILASRIYLVPVEGGEPRLFYEEQPTEGRTREVRLLDWTADGRYLAISSEHKGNPALYLLPISDGKPAGEPIFVRYGNFESGATTAAGAMIYDALKPGGIWAVHVASLDVNGRPGAWKRLDLPLGNNDSPSASWSGDSNQIVYVAGNDDVGQTGQVVHVRNLSTGEDREIYHAPGWTGCVWAAQQPKLFCHVDKVGEKSDIISIAVDSGEIERLHTFPGDLVITNPSRDNRSLYMIRFGPFTPQGEEQDAMLLRWEIATGQETALQHGSRTTGLALGSPDERWLIRRTPQSIEIRPTSGGEWKRLVALGKGLQGPVAGHDFGATPDGKWVLYRDVDSAGKWGLFRVSTAGGQPEWLGDYPTSGDPKEVSLMEISPDGRKVSIESADLENADELWSLENFVPPAPKR